MPLSSKILSQIIDGSAIPYFVINKEHIVTHWNRAMEALSLRPREDVIGKDDHWKLFYEEKRPSMADLIVDEASSWDIKIYYRDKFREYPLIEGAYEAEDYFPHLGDEGRWLHFTASPIKDDDGKVIGAIETVIDVSERKKLENNLRYYLQQLTKAQEEERKFVARELHDDLAQILGSLSRQVDNLLRKKHSFGPDEEAALDDIRTLLKQGQQSMQAFIQNLRPSLLDDLGLIPALRSLTKNMENSERIAIKFTVLGEEKRFSSEVELSVFRIVQEALNNIKKHAQATKVHVAMVITAVGIDLTVRDNGNGFTPPDDIGDLARSGKLGLMGMKERVWLLGGKIKFSSVPGRGTALTVHIQT
jgi:two-component system, NarL family, sensor histidine kinase DegS